MADRAARIGFALARLGDELPVVAVGVQLEVEHAMDALNQRLAVAGAVAQGGT